MPRLIQLSSFSILLALAASPAAVAEETKAQVAGPAAAQAPAPARPPAPTQPPPAPPAISPHPGAPQPQVPQMVEVVPLDRVLGRIGDRVFREQDFESWLKTLAGPRRFEQMSKAPGGLARYRQQYLDGQVLAARARKAGLERLPEFEEELKIQKDQVLVKLLMNEDREASEGRRLKERIESPSEEEIRAAFEKNSQRYDTPEKFSARHILVGVKGSPRMGDRGLSDDEAKAKIARIQGELAAGKSFADLAKEHSDDPSNKNNGGLIKDSAFGGFVKEFEEAVRTQPIGKVGDPVKTAFGYHLIVVEDRTPKQAAVFEQVRERVKQQLIPERREAIYKEFLEEARKQVGFVAGPEPAAKPAGTASPTKP